MRSFPTWIFFVSILFWSSVPSVQSQMAILCYLWLYFISLHTIVSLSFFFASVHFFLCTKLTDTLGFFFGSWFHIKSNLLFHADKTYLDDIIWTLRKWYLKLHGTIWENHSGKWNYIRRSQLSEPMLCQQQVTSGFLSA